MSSASSLLTSALLDTCLELNIRLKSNLKASLQKTIKKTKWGMMMKKENGNRGRVGQGPLYVSSMNILILTSEMLSQWIHPDSAHPSPGCPPGLQEQRTLSTICSKSRDQPLSLSFECASSWPISIKNLAFYVFSTAWLNTWLNNNKALNPLYSRKFGIHFILTFMNTSTLFTLLIKINVRG